MESTDAVVQLIWEVVKGAAPKEIRDVYDVDNPPICNERSPPIGAIGLVLEEEKFFSDYRETLAEIDEFYQKILGKLKTYKNSTLYSLTHIKLADQAFYRRNRILVFALIRTETQEEAEEIGMTKNGGWKNNPLNSSKIEMRPHEFGMALRVSRAVPANVKSLVGELLESLPAGTEFVSIDIMESVHSLTDQYFFIFKNLNISNIYRADPIFYRMIERDKDTEQIVEINKIIQVKYYDKDEEEVLPRFNRSKDEF